MPYDFEKNELSFVDGPPGVGVYMAIRPTQEQVGDDRMLFFFQPMRQRAFEVKKVLQDSEQRFSFTDGRGRRFSLSPMTLAVYRKNVMPILNGKPDFDTVGKMRDYFLRKIWRE